MTKFINNFWTATCSVPVKAKGVDDQRRHGEDGDRQPEPPFRVGIHPQNDSGRDVCPNVEDVVGDREYCTEES